MTGDSEGPFRPHAEENYNHKCPMCDGTDNVALVMRADIVDMEVDGDASGTVVVWCSCGVVFIPTGPDVEETVYSFAVEAMEVDK